MMKIPHASMEYNGVNYVDYTLYTDQLEWRWQGANENSLCLESDFAENFTDGTKLKKLCNPTFRPQKGDAIFVAPGCPYANEDIRKNYTIKRNPDTGVCNVFSSMKDQGSGVRLYGKVLIMPDRKAIFMSANNPLLLANTFFANDPSEMIDCGNKQYWFRKYNVPSVYFSLLEGKLTTPCVYYDQLDINSENKLTLDTLRIVYETLRTSVHIQDSEKNAVIQLNVLNQHDWRNYQGTIAVMLEMLRKKGGIGRAMMNTKSRYSKPVKELLSCTSLNWQNDDDRHMSTEFVSSLLGITGQKFVRPSDLIRKTEEIGLSLSTFDSIFYTIVKIKPVF